MTDSERIERVKEYLKISSNALSKELGLPNPQVFYDIKAGKCGISKDLANKIQEKYLISAAWLLTNEGKMLKGDTASVEGLPLIPIDVIAGFPKGEMNGVSLVECEKYIVPEFLKLKAEYMIRVSGSSMYPKYSNCDVLACRKLSSYNFFQWGKVYVIDTEQGALVKRLFEDKESKENVICHSENTEKYPDFRLPKSEIRSVSIVLGSIKID